MSRSNRGRPRQGISLLRLVAILSLLLPLFLLQGCGDDSDTADEPVAPPPPPPPPAEFTGAATFQSGGAASNIVVVAEGVDSDRTFSVVTNTSGEFNFGEIAAGTYRVFAEDDSIFGSVTVSFDGEDTLSFDVLFEQGTVIRGTVQLLDEEGEPFAPEVATVALVGTGLTTTPSAAGSYEFIVSQGTYEVAITADGFVGVTSESFDANEPEVFVDALTLNADVTPPPEGPEPPELARGLSGVVISNVDNQPLPGATVTIDGQQTTVTDEFGAYYFEDIEPGEHIIIVTADGFAASYAEIVVREAGLADFPVSWIPGTQVNDVLGLIAEVLNTGLANDFIDEIETDQIPETVDELIDYLITNLPVDIDLVGTANFLMARSDGGVEGQVLIDQGGGAIPAVGATVKIYRTSDFDTINIDNEDFNSTNPDGSETGTDNDGDPNGCQSCPDDGIDVIVPSDSEEDDVEQTPSTAPLPVLVAEVTTDENGRYSAELTTGLQYGIDVIFENGPFAEAGYRATTDDLTTTAPSLEPDSNNAEDVPASGFEGIFIASGDTSTVDFILRDDSKPYVTRVELSDGSVLPNRGNIFLPEADVGGPDYIDVVFNEPMNPSLIDQEHFILKRVQYNTGGPVDFDFEDAGTEVSAAYRWVNDDTTLRVTPAAPLPLGFTYRLELLKTGTGCGDTSPGEGPAGTCALLYDVAGNPYDGFKELGVNLADRNLTILPPQDSFDAPPPGDPADPTDDDFNGQDRPDLGDFLSFLPETQARLFFQVRLLDPEFLALDTPPGQAQCSADSAEDAGIIDIAWSPASGQNIDPAEYLVTVSLVESPDLFAVLGTVPASLNEDLTFTTSVAAAEDALIAANILPPEVGGDPRTGGGLIDAFPDYPGNNSFDGGVELLIGVAVRNQDGELGPVSHVVVGDNTGPQLEATSRPTSSSKDDVDHYAFHDLLVNFDGSIEPPGTSDTADAGKQKAWTDALYVFTSRLGAQVFDSASITIEEPGIDLSANGILIFDEGFIGGGANLDYINGEVRDPAGFTLEGLFTDPEPGDFVDFLPPTISDERALRYEFSDIHIVDTGDELRVDLIDSLGNETCKETYFVDDVGPFIADLEVDPTGVLTLTLSEPVRGASLDSFRVGYDTGEGEGLDYFELDDDAGLDATSFDYDGDRTIVIEFDADTFNANLSGATDQEFVITAAPLSGIAVDDQLLDLSNDGNVAQEVGLEADDVFQPEIAGVGFTFDKVVIVFDEDMDLDETLPAINRAFATAPYSITVNGQACTTSWADGGDGLFQSDESVCAEDPSIQAFVGEPRLVTAADVFGARPGAVEGFNPAFTSRFFGTDGVIQDEEAARTIVLDYTEHFFAQLTNDDTLTVFGPSEGATGLTDEAGNPVVEEAFELADKLPPKIVNISAGTQTPGDGVDTIVLQLSEALSAESASRVTDPLVYEVFVDGTEVFVAGTPVYDPETLTITINVPEGNVLDGDGQLLADVTVRLEDEDNDGDGIPDFVLEDINDNRDVAEDDTPDVVAPEVAAVAANYATPLVAGGLDDDVLARGGLLSGFSGTLTLTIGFDEPVVANLVTDVTNWTFPDGYTVEEIQDDSAGLGPDVGSNFVNAIVVTISIAGPTTVGEVITLNGGTLVDQAGNVQADPVDVPVVADVFDVESPYITDITFDPADGLSDNIVLTISEELALDADAEDTVELELATFEFGASFGGNAQISAPLYTPGDGDTLPTITIFLDNGALDELDNCGAPSFTVNVDDPAAGTFLADLAGNNLLAIYPQGPEGVADGIFLDSGVDVVFAGNPAGRSEVDNFGFLLEDATDLNGDPVAAGSLSPDADVTDDAGEPGSFVIDLSVFSNPTIVASNWNTALVSQGASPANPEVVIVTFRICRMVDELSFENGAGYTLPPGFSFFQGLQPEVAPVNLDANLQGGPGAPGMMEADVSLFLRAEAPVTDDLTITFPGDAQDLIGNVLEPLEFSAVDGLAPIVQAGSFTVETDGSEELSIEGDSVTFTFNEPVELTPAFDEGGANENDPFFTFSVLRDLNGDGVFSFEIDNGLVAASDLDFPDDFVVTNRGIPRELVEISGDGTQVTITFDSIQAFGFPTAGDLELDQYNLSNLAYLISPVEDAIQDLANPNNDPDLPGPNVVDPAAILDDQSLFLQGDDDRPVVGVQAFDFAVGNPADAPIPGTVGDVSFNVLNVDVTFLIDDQGGNPIAGIPVVEGLDVETFFNEAVNPANYTITQENLNDGDTIEVVQVAGNFDEEPSVTLTILITNPTDGGELDNGRLSVGDNLVIDGALLPFLEGEMEIVVSAEEQGTQEQLALDDIAVQNPVPGPADDLIEVLVNFEQIGPLGTAAFIPGREIPRDAFRIDVITADDPDITPDGAVRQFTFDPFGEVQIVNGQTLRLFFPAAVNNTNDELVVFRFDDQDTEDFEQSVQPEEVEVNIRNRFDLLTQPLVLGEGVPVAAAPNDASELFFPRDEGQAFIEGFDLGDWTEGFENPGVGGEPAIALIQTIEIEVPSGLIPDAGYYEGEVLGGPTLPQLYSTSGIVGVTLLEVVEDRRSETDVDLTFLFLLAPGADVDDDSCIIFNTGVVWDELGQFFSDEDALFCGDPNDRIQDRP